MNETIKTGVNFIGYEYKEVVVKRGMEDAYAEGYANFGWIPIENTPYDIGMATAKLRFKRERKLLNKAELTRFQRQFEKSIKKIVKLERGRAAKASAVACAIGLIGLVFMAGSVWFFLAGTIPPSIALAAPALISWVAAIISFIKLKAKRTKEVAPMIDQQYDDIHEVWKKAHGLLA